MRGQAACRWIPVWANNHLTFREAISTITAAPPSLPHQYFIAANRECSQEGDTSQNFTLWVIVVHQLLAVFQ